MTCACCSLFAGLVIMALLQFVATINSGMLLYNKDFIFIEGSEFKHASECLPAEKDKVSRASSFTFTPTKKCSDYTTGDLKENLFKVIRPTGADQHSYVSANHTCCIKYLDGKKTVPYKHSTNSVVLETNEYIEQLRGSIAAIKDGAATAKDVRKIKNQFGPDSPEYADVIKKAGTKVVNAVKS